MSNKKKLPSALLARECASLALDNAIKLLGWAQEMGTKKDWGIGTAHLVLSLEEGAKSVVLAIYGLECLPLMQNSLDLFISKYPLIELDSIDLKEIVRTSFSSHSTKHVIALWLLLFFWMSKQQKKKSNSENNINFLEQILIDLPKNLRKTRALGTIVNWLLKADLLKKRGLYVDYDGKKSLTPVSIPENDFVEGLNVTHALIDKLKGIRELWVESKIETDDFIKNVCSQRSNIESDISAEINLLFRKMR